MKDTTNIHKSFNEDFIKLFLPTILLLPLLFINQLENIAWMSVVFLSVMDISHVFSTGVEPLIDREVRNDKTTIYLFSIGIAIGAIIAFGFTRYAEYIFFYSIIFHNMRQGLGLTLIYYKKESQKKISVNLLKAFYYFCTLFPILIFHFEKIVVDYGTLEKIYFVIPLENLFDFSSSEIVSIVNTLKSVFVICLSGIAIKIFRNLSGKTLFSFLFFSLIYIYSYLLTNDLLYSSILLMASHAVPYLFLIQTRTSKHSQENILRKFTPVILSFVILIGFCYYYFFYRHVGEAHQMSALTKFLIITPSYIHYAFDGYIWTSKNKRFKDFLNL